MIEDAMALIRLVINQKMSNPEEYTVTASCQGCRRKAIEICDQEDFDGYLIMHTHGKPKWMTVMVYRKLYFNSLVHKISLEPSS